MTPETKKHLKYAAIAIVGIGGAYFLYEHLSAGDAAAASAAANAQAQQQATTDESNQAELAELGTSGVSLSAPTGGLEIPVESFSDELDSILSAAGMSSNGTAPASTGSSAPTTSGTPVSLPASVGPITTEPKTTIIAGVGVPAAILSPAHLLNSRTITSVQQ